MEQKSYLEKTKQIFFSGLLLVVIAGVGWSGYVIQKSRMQRGFFQEGLATYAKEYQDTIYAYNQLSTQFDKLKNNYNQVLARTSITEIHIENGRCFVVLKNAERLIKKIETKVNLNKEIF